jgi:hypothetical protein
MILNPIEFKSLSSLKKTLKGPRIYHQLLGMRVKTFEPAIKLPQRIQHFQIPTVSDKQICPSGLWGAEMKLIALGLPDRCGKTDIRRQSTLINPSRQTRRARKAQ